MKKGRAYSREIRYNGVDEKPETEDSNMLYTNNTEKLLGLQGVNVKKVEDNEKSVLIYAELEKKKQKCPCCGESTDKIHDYREQTVKPVGGHY